MALLSHAAFLLLRLIITQDPSLRHRYWFLRYYDPSDSLTVISAFSLSHLLTNTSCEEPLGYPTFTSLPLITCRALRPRGAFYPSPNNGIDDVAFCLNVRHGPYPFGCFGAQSLASAYGLQSSYLRLIQIVTSLYSRLGTRWTGNPFPDRYHKRLVNKAPRGAHILT